MFKKFFIANYREPGCRSDLEKFVNERFPLDSLGEELFKDIKEIYPEGMKQEENFVDQAAL